MNPWKIFQKNYWKYFWKNSWMICYWRDSWANFWRNLWKLFSRNHRKIFQRKPLEKIPNKPQKMFLEKFVMKFHGTEEENSSENFMRIPQAHFTEIYEQFAISFSGRLFWRKYSLRFFKWTHGGISEDIQEKNPSKDLWWNS